MCFYIKLSKVMKIVFSILILLLMQFIGEASVKQMAHNDVSYDENGDVIPLCSYGEVVAHAAHFLKYDDPRVGGYACKYVYSALRMSSDYLKIVGDNGRNFPAGEMLGMGIDANLSLYAYTGDTYWLDESKYIADQIISNGTTPSSWIWPNVPYPGGDPNTPGIWHGTKGN